MLVSEMIFFDAAGTLFEVRGGVGESYSRLARAYNLSVEPEVIEQAFTASFKAQPPMAAPAHTSESELREFERQWWRALARDVFAEYDFPRFDQFFVELFEYFRGAEAWTVFDDVAPTLETFRSRGQPMAVISNFDSRLDDLLRALKLDQYFDGAHISTRVGAAKPDARIFQTALRHHQLEARQAAHIGDSPREDVEGATAAGIKAVLIDRGDKHPQLRRIRTLVELLGR